MDLASAFPPGIPFPELLSEFRVWSESRQPGELGWFEFMPTRLDDYWIENGSALAERFALFMRLPDGSAIGFWKYDSAIVGEALPVVLLGSEGQQEILAPDFPSFLWKWAEGALEQAYDLDIDSEYLTEEGLSDARPALRNWLASKGITQTCNEIERQPDSLALQEFFSQWQEQQVKRWAENSTLQAIASLLRNHARLDLKDWEHVSVRATISEDGVQITRSPLTGREQAEAKLLLEHLREEMAGDYPGRGLWFSAEVRWFTKFGATVIANYLSIPEKLDDKTLQDSLTRFPRDKFWLPDGL